MITKNILHKNFAKEKKNFKIYKDFIGLIKNSNNSELLKSLGLKYKYNFNKKKILKLKKINPIEFLVWEVLYLELEPYMIF